jgi:hypothetical protein
MNAIWFNSAGRHEEQKGPLLHIICDLFSLTGWNGI